MQPDDEFLENGVKVSFKKLVPEEASYKQDNLPLPNYFKIVAVRRENRKDINGQCIDKDGRPAILLEEYSNQSLIWSGTSKDKGHLDALTKQMSTKFETYFYLWNIEIVENKFIKPQYNVDGNPQIIDISEIKMLKKLLDLNFEKNNILEKAYNIITEKLDPYLEEKDPKIVDIINSTNDMNAYFEKYFSLEPACIESEQTSSNDQDSFNVDELLSLSLAEKKSQKNLLVN
ncbi:hypothetical protein [Spiroplasma sp. DGKH1]|uniref:hypothetical protein n=1 Tax=Spiroplasma sp. DGKH1 TaxID=3050074 RepID=UPI0034C68D04